MDVSNQKAIDHKMIDLDGTPNKSNLGAMIKVIAAPVAKAAAVKPV